MNHQENTQHASEIYLTFMMSHEQCGLPLSRIRNIQSWEKLKPTADPSSYVVGYITSLTEEYIPVIDLRKRLGLGDANCDRHTLIIEVMPDLEGDQKLVGFAVDSSRPFQDINLQDIKEESDYEGKINNAYVQAVGMSGKNTITILRVSQIINQGDNTDVELN